MAELIAVGESVLRERVLGALTAAGADETSAQACTRALMHASRVGCDSHGVRLAAHYAAMMRCGRVNPRPRRQVRRTGVATAMLDADHGLGHASAYAAMALACELAQSAGTGAVGVIRSSHFGAAGAYAVAGAAAGCVALATTNADSLVTLHGGARAFHGTNPLAVAADAEGAPTADPDATEMLLPLGGRDFGYKGAGLAGLATLLSAVLTGATLDHAMLPMFRTDDFHSPRNLGHFCLALDPGRFIGRAAYDDAVARYLAALRAVPPRPGERVLAPGDKEWETEAARLRAGIPVDAETAAFLGLSAA